MAGVPGGTSAHEIIRAGARVFQEPFSQYPYIIHGLKDGLVSGLRTTAVESCTVATAIVFAIQTAAEVVHDMTGVEDDNLLQGPRYYRSKLAMQPTGFKDGLSKAYSALGASVKEAYSDIFVSRVLIKTTTMSQYSVWEKALLIFSVLCCVTVDLLPSCVSKK